ncbi:MAG TPA: isocitrate lyase/phosphoenolpyruvate mutase family protein [Pyrinomonadaceae bacterium]|nr:isocitrate lyase/phosphoenolpyruvate mutase family protein [Pyrinomonadaceae bacterium]
MSGHRVIIPNPYDAGTARLLAYLGFEALATTTAGCAFSVGLTSVARFAGFDSYWGRDPRVTLAALAHPGLLICRASGAG